MTTITHKLLSICDVMRKKLTTLLGIAALSCSIYWYASRSTLSNIWNYSKNKVHELTYRPPISKHRGFVDLDIYSKQRYEFNLQQIKLKSNKERSWVNLFALNAETAPQYIRAIDWDGDKSIDYMRIQINKKLDLETTVRLTRSKNGAAGCWVDTGAGIYIQNPYEDWVIDEFEELAESTINKDN